MFWSVYFSIKETFAGIVLKLVDNNNNRTYNNSIKSNEQ